jgi:hypothetical protein
MFQALYGRVDQQDLALVVKEKYLFISPQQYMETYYSTYKLLLLT